MQTPRAPARKRYTELDKRLVRAVRDIRVLDMVAWPAAVERRFLDDLHHGHEILPRFEYHAPDFSAQRAEQAARFEDRLRGSHEPIRSQRHRGWQERE